MAGGLLSGGKTEDQVSSNDPAERLAEHRREALEAEARRKAERQAMLKERMQSALDRGDRLRKRTRELSKELSAWDDKITPLLTNEEGRYLSGERHWVDSFEEAYRSPRPGFEKQDELLRRLDTLLEPIQQAWDSADWSASPSGSLDDRLSDLDSDIENQLEAAKRPRLKIESLLVAAKEEGIKGERTLEEAIQYFKAQTEARAALAERRARQKAEDEAASKLDREANETARHAEMLKVQEAEKETQLAELRTLLKDGKTKLLLAPFATPGYTQPDRSMSAKKVPISYSKLIGGGYLDADERGLDRLRNLVKDTTDKARPRWDMNHYLVNLPTADYEKLSSAQAFLRDHGALLVELGVLSP